MNKPVPWKMCRTCHSRGRTDPKCEHRGCGKGACGQCGEYRKLVECHGYDFREAHAGRVYPVWPRPDTPRTRHGPGRWAEYHDGLWLGYGDDLRPWVARAI